MYTVPMQTMPIMRGTQTHQNNILQQIELLAEYIDNPDEFYQTLCCLCNNANESSTGNTTLPPNESHDTGLSWTAYLIIPLYNGCCILDSSPSLSTLASYIVASALFAIYETKYFSHDQAKNIKNMLIKYGIAFKDNDKISDVSSVVKLIKSQNQQSRLKHDDQQGANTITRYSCTSSKTHSTDHTNKPIHIPTKCDADNPNKTQLRQMHTYCAHLYAQYVKKNSTTIKGYITSHIIDKTQSVSVKRNFFTRMLIIFISACCLVIPIFCIDILLAFGASQSTLFIVLIVSSIARWALFTIISAVLLTSTNKALPTNNNDNEAASEYQPSMNENEPVTNETIKKFQQLINDSHYNEMVKQLLNLQDEIIYTLLHQQFKYCGRNESLLYIIENCKLNDRDLWNVRRKDIFYNWRGIYELQSINNYNEFINYISNFDKSALSRTQALMIFYHLLAIADRNMERKTACYMLLRQLINEPDSIFSALRSKSNSKEIALSATANAMYGGAAFCIKLVLLLNSSTLSFFISILSGPYAIWGFIVITIVSFLIFHILGYLRGLGFIVARQLAMDNRCIDTLNNQLAAPEIQDYDKIHNLQLIDFDDEYYKLLFVNDQYEELIKFSKLSTWHARLALLRMINLSKAKNTAIPSDTIKSLINNVKIISDDNRKICINMALATNTWACVLASLFMLVICGTPSLIMIAIVNATVIILVGIFEAWATLVNPKKFSEILNFRKINYIQRIEDNLTNSLNSQV